MIDQSSDTKFAVADHFSAIKEDLSDIQCHLCFLIGPADFLDLLYHCTECHADITKSFFFQIICHFHCKSGDFILRAVLADIMHHDHIVFINLSHKIISCTSDIRAHHFQCIRIPPVLRFQNHRHTAGICLNMKLFGAAVNIHQKKIIQQKIFDKIILIEPFLVCYQQTLHLKCDHFAQHVGIFTASRSNQNIFQLLIIIYFKILMSLNLL